MLYRGLEGTCIVPIYIYTGKGDRRECANDRRISILSILGKICYSTDK